MAVEQDFLVRVNYQLQGVEDSINVSKRALFTLNAIRLSIRDIQQVLSGPSIANILFTAIQLTRTLTLARRLTRALTKEQAALGAASLFGNPFTGAQARGPGFLIGLLTGIPSVAAGAPLLSGIVVGAFAIGLGARFYSDREQRLRREFRERGREVAKSQGLEP